MRRWILLLGLLTGPVSAAGATTPTSPDTIYEPTPNIFAPQSGQAKPQAVGQGATAQPVVAATKTVTPAATTAPQAAATAARRGSVLTPAQQASAQAASAAVTTLSATAKVPDEPTLQLYTQDELLSWIAAHTHLQRVKSDQCQLTPDIEARARVMQLPSYEFLWADMLITGTCVPANPVQGIDYLWMAAQQGMPAALLRLATYYDKGRFVQQDTAKAVVLMHEAAALGYLEAQMGWVEMLNRGRGSPLDYEEAYSWLHHSVIADDKTHARATRLLRDLARRMPPGVVQQAKRYALN